VLARRSSSPHARRQDDESGESANPGQQPPHADTSRPIQGTAVEHNPPRPRRSLSAGRPPRRSRDQLPLWSVNGELIPTFFTPVPIVRVIIRAHPRQPDNQLAVAPWASFGSTEGSSVCALLRAVRDPRHCRSPIEAVIYARCSSIEVRSVTSMARSSNKRCSKGEISLRCRPVVLGVSRRLHRNAYACEPHVTRFGRSTKRR
jgi:hypothetical protein